MKTAQILIVEDEPIIAADLEKQLTRMGHDVIATTDSGSSAISLLSQFDPDLILMDIQLEGDLDGIDTAHEINKFSDAPIIFLTSNTDERTFNRARLTQPYAFMSKPFRTTDIEHSIALALEESFVELSELEEQNIANILSDRIFIRNKSAFQKVLLKDIIYIEAEGAYCKIYLADKSFIISSTLKKFLSSIKFNKLIRIHRSYIVNVEFVDQIGEGYIFANNYKVPVGRAYRDLVQKYFKSI